MTMYDTKKLKNSYVWTTLLMGGGNLRNQYVNLVDGGNKHNSIALRFVFLIILRISIYYSYHGSSVFYFKPQSTLIY